MWQTPTWLSLSVKLQCAISTFPARSPFRSNVPAMVPFVFTAISGSWPQLRSSARVTATWHQVSPGVKLLAFNFYGIANAASERAKFNRNNELLGLIFTIAAQFGDIPILIARDFQMEPGVYPSVQLALDHWGWADPLLRTDGQGEAIRPCTFFQHAAPWKEMANHPSTVS